MTKQLEDIAELLFSDSLKWISRIWGFSVLRLLRDANQLHSVSRINLVHEPKCSLRAACIEACKIYFSPIHKIVGNCAEKWVKKKSVAVDIPNNGHVIRKLLADADILCKCKWEIMCKWVQNTACISNWANIRLFCTVANAELCIKGRLFSVVAQYNKNIKNCLEVWATSKHRTFNKGILHC